MIDPKNVTPIKPTVDPKSGEQKTRPTTPPKSNKDFSKLVDDRKGSKYSDDTELDTASVDEQPKSPLEMATKKDIGSVAPKSEQQPEKPMPKLQRSDDYRIASRSPEPRREVSRTETPKDRVRDKEVSRKDDSRGQEKEIDQSEEGEGIRKVQPEGEEDLFTSAEKKPMDKDLSALRGKEIPKGVEEGVDKAPKGDFGKSKTEKTSKTESVMAVRTDMPQDIPGITTSAPQMNMQAPQAEAPRANMAATIQTLVSEIVTIQKNGQLDTVVTLKNPPILNGATIKISSFESAQKEVNITFSNLSPQAKMFLDQKLLQSSLIEQLDKRNIVVHQLITTTQPDTALPAEPKPAEQQRQGRGDEGGTGGGGGRQGGGEGEGQGGQQQRQPRR